jgi:hypothetical protein
MRTTLDLPDELLKRAKIEAVERGTTLRDLMGAALERELRQPARAEREPARKRARWRTQAQACTRPRVALHQLRPAVSSLG